MEEDVGRGKGVPVGAGVVLWVRGASVRVGEDEEAGFLVVGWRGGGGHWKGELWYLRRRGERWCLILHFGCERVGEVMDV